MTDPFKLTKLIDRLQIFIYRLESDQDLIIHQRVNQFYYMQKVIELNVLREKFYEIRKRASTLSDHMDHEYARVFTQWSRDLKWLNSHLRIRDGHKSIR